MRREFRLGAALRILRGILWSRDPETRYRCRHEFLAALARLWGFRVYNKDLLWLEDPAHLKAWAAFPENDGRVMDRRFVLLQLADWTAMLPGDTAECGVLNGAGSHLICYARAHREHPGTFKHFGFDSFEGLPEPTQRDRPALDRTFRWKKHDLSSPLERARANLSQFPFAELVRGWIPQGFERVADRRFSLVHVDVDLYQSTYDSLAFFYPRLVPGGVLICDDYGYEACPGAHAACDEFLADKPEKIIHLPTGQGFIIRGRPSDG